MDAPALEFQNGMFVLVMGRGLLHHLDLTAGVVETGRVLKPGRRGLFMEPLAANPRLRMFRLLSPKARTEDERPLTSEDLERIAGNGWVAENSYYGVIAAPMAVVTSLLLRPFENNFLLRLADKVEQRINKIPKLHPFNQYALLNLIRK